MSLTEAGRVFETYAAQIAVAVEGARPAVAGRGRGAGASRP